MPGTDLSVRWHSLFCVWEETARSFGRGGYQPPGRYRKRAVKINCSGPEVGGRLIAAPTGLGKGYPLISSRNTGRLLWIMS